ncbi:hypothetical protein [Streptomyces sp. WAC01526]|uniref:hypothetical protein n=1 Tax=Streptomyces sp. WAC01526 TaxID=2588709 RepID=UPI0011DF4B08|nr:hypothetical protein [Streptomyces sp. WAC01526]
MATSQWRAGKWKTAVIAGAAALAVTGGITAPAGAAPQPGSVTDRLSIGNQDLSGGVQLGDPATPRDHPGGRPLIRHHWVVRFGYATVSALNQRTNYAWQRNYKDWTVAIVGNNIQGKEVTIYTKITNQLIYGEGGVTGGETEATSKMALAHNTIVAQGNVNIITEIVNVHFISPKFQDVYSAQCRAQEDLRNTVEKLACLMG